jgi:pyruvate/2-oxoglutarate dehydrogenase complex dihydrolipoamide dehydrogenase (E3) component
MGVDLIHGEARLTGPREVTVATPDGERVLTTRFVLLCTGSRPALPPVPGLDTVPVLTSENLFELQRPPDSLVVLGGGAIGTELAQGLCRLGVGVTLVEREPRLLPVEEPELAERLSLLLARDGVDLRLGTAAERVSATTDGVRVELSDGRTVEAAGVLVATGRVANVDSLGLAALGLEDGPEGVHVDGRSRSHLPTIYVVGDAAAGRPAFTHIAAYDAVAAVRDMFFPGRGFAPKVVPWATFTDPELARVGMTADEARATHGERAVRVHRLELHHVDRARADGTTDGMVMLVTVRRRLVGAHVLAPGAGDLVHELALAIRSGIGIDEVAQLVHVYPTVATGIGRLAGDPSIARARRVRWLAKAGRWFG